MPSKLNAAENLKPMADVKKQGLQLDGIAASSAIDTSSESIDIENLDISSLQQGHGVFLVEHKKPKDEKAGYQDVIGAVTFAKKIFSEDDCDDERQLGYWKQIELPFCYIRGELFDADGHEGARAAASIIRFYQRNKMPIVLRYSIDGQTIEREGNVLKHCIARDVAITLKPCNQSCVSGVIEPTKATNESPFDELSRSEEGLRRMVGVNFEMLPPVEVVQVEKSETNVIQNFIELSKAMTAGGGMVAPGNAVGGAALGKEDVMFKSRVKAAFRDWNRREPLMAHMTKSLPDAHPTFLEKFVDLVDKNRLRKASELHEHLEKAIGAGEATGVHPPKPEDLAADAKKTPTGTVKTAVGGNSSGNMKENQKPQDDTPLLPHQTPEHRKATIAAVNAELAAKNPEAAKVQSTPPPLPPPHVPGLRIGMTPGQGEQRDAAAAAPAKPVLPHQTPLSRAVAMQQINNDIAMRNPEAARLQTMKSEVEAHGAEPMMPKVKQQPLLHVNGSRVKPGVLAFRSGMGHELDGTTHRLVGEDEKNYHVIPNSGSDYRISLVPKNLERKAFDVVEPWKPVAPKDLKVLPEHMSFHSQSPEQLAMGGKINMGSARTEVKDGIHASKGQAPWKQRGAGSTIFVKPNSPMENQNEDQPAAIKETSFHNLAKDFFGQKDAVPTTASFHHPVTGKLFSAQEFVRGGRHVASNNPVLEKWHQQGTAQKMHVMDYVLGNVDRHQGNFVVTKDDQPKLIDNGGAFRYDMEGKYPHPMPDYVPYNQRHTTWGPETESWIKSLDPKVLGDKMLKEGLSPYQASMATARLQGLHDSLAKGHPLSYTGVNRKGLHK